MRLLYTVTRHVSTTFDCAVQNAAITPPERHETPRTYPVRSAHRRVFRGITAVANVILKTSMDRLRNVNTDLLALYEERQARQEYDILGDGST